jgi:ssDNA-binding replication factor A large subunit
MKISELIVNQRIDFLDAVVKEISEVKEFSKFGRTGRVATATIKDKSGEIQLILWDEQIDSVKKGDKIRLINAYVKEWQGEKQINVGRVGSIETLK